ncbi:MAG TPA: hypothetical protein VHL58_02610 [Thermoanaerobaculia bacterium]|nr:hypothetical protein [Thermoanaerobaculia bacterium]
MIRPSTAIVALSVMLTIGTSFARGRPARRPPPVSTSPQIAGCPILPADNEWNRDVSRDAVDPNSAAYMAHMNGSSRFLHPDFGSNPDFGIPFDIVPATQALVPVTFQYADESDPGPYPIPPNARVEAGGDRHVLVLQQDRCVLYELFDAVYLNPGWHAGAGAVFDLRSNALRPDGYTSADAAGLPILPGLARFDEATSGEIRHALRFTVQSTQRAYIHPATHFASSSTDPAAPPMGLRVRLKAGFDLSGYTGTARTILAVLKKYGMFVADNGSDWFLSGETTTRWNDDDLDQLKRVPASAFEVVKAGTILH